MHFTVSHIVNEGPKQFGFATGDDGVTQYFIPRAVVIAQQMGVGHVGEGFTAAVRPCPSPYVGKENHDHISLPITWDNAISEDNIDLDGLNRRLGDMTTELNNFAAEIQAVRDWLNS